MFSPLAKAMSTPPTGQGPTLTPPTLNYSFPASTKFFTIRLPSYSDGGYSYFIARAPSMLTPWSVTYLGKDLSGCAQGAIGCSGVEVYQLAVPAGGKGITVPFVSLQPFNISSGLGSNPTSYVFNLTFY
jgi:hypothetical protein